MFCLVLGADGNPSHASTVAYSDGFSCGIAAITSVYLPQTDLFRDCHDKTFPSGVRLNPELVGLRDAPTHFPPRVPPDFEQVHPSG
jgi:hypothetical protein